MKDIYPAGMLTLIEGRPVERPSVPMGQNLLDAVRALAEARDQSLAEFMRHAAAREIVRTRSEEANGP